MALRLTVLGLLQRAKDLSLSCAPHYFPAGDIVIFHYCKSIECISYMCDRLWHTPARPGGPPWTGRIPGEFVCACVVEKTHFSPEAGFSVLRGSPTGLLRTDGYTRSRPT